MAGPENNEVQSADPCAAFATELHGKVAEQARRRQVIEQRWYEDTRQYYGFYDEETEKRLKDEKGSSKLFVNLTRPKTRVMRARLKRHSVPERRAELGHPGDAGARDRGAGREDAAGSAAGSAGWP